MYWGLLVEGLGGVRAHVSATRLPTPLLRAALLPTPLLEPELSAAPYSWVVRTGAPDAIQQLGWMPAQHHMMYAPSVCSHDAVQIVMLCSSLAGNLGHTGPLKGS